MSSIPTDVFTDTKLNDKIDQLGKYHIKTKWTNIMNRTLSENLLAGEQLHSNTIPTTISRNIK